METTHKHYVVNVCACIYYSKNNIDKVDTSCF